MSAENEHNNWVAYSEYKHYSILPLYEPQQAGAL